MRTRSRVFTLTAALLALGLSACAPETPSGGSGGMAGQPAADFRILSGSENRDLEPLLREAAGAAGAIIVVDYKGSVDTMLELQKPDLAYDAVWPASSLWISLGDSAKRVKDARSIMRSPLVLGVKLSLAKRLGWVGTDVTVDQILQAVRAGQLRFMMTSATQSNSGASAYLGFLYASAATPTS